MADQPAPVRTLPPGGPKKSPFVGGGPKGDMQRNPTSPNLGGGKKAPPVLPKRPNEEGNGGNAHHGGPPKIPPRTNTVANIPARVPRVQEPAAEQTPAAEEPAAAQPVDQTNQQTDSNNLPPQSADFEAPKTALKTAPSFRDTIAIPAQSAAALAATPANPNSPANGLADPAKGLDAALADPLFRKVEVVIAQKRDNIANEILTTEQSYIRALTIVNELYRKPMLDAAKAGLLGSFNEDFVTEIFSRNFQDILRVNFTLLSGLVDRLSAWTSEQVLGDVLLDLVSSRRPPLDVVFAR